MIHLTSRLEEIVKEIGLIKSVKGLEEYFQSLSVEEQNNALLSRLIDKRKSTIKQLIKDEPLGISQIGNNFCI